MNNKEFGKNLEKSPPCRITIHVIHLSSTLPNTLEARVVRNQFAKAGTNVGDKYREVNSSKSKADLVHKTKICETGASETVFWLTVIAAQKWGRMNMKSDHCSESQVNYWQYLLQQRRLKINS